MPQLVLMENGLFIVSDGSGDIPIGDERMGLYYHDTRYLSTFVLTINDHKPMGLSSSWEENFIGQLQLANPTLLSEEGQVVLPHTISVMRRRFIRNGLHERTELLNYNSFPVRIQLGLLFSADFRDMFDVRGFERAARGALRRPVALRNRVMLRYLGLDRVSRDTEITFETEPTRYELEELLIEASTEAKLGIIVPGGDVLFEPTADEDAHAVEEQPGLVEELPEHERHDQHMYAVKVIYDIELQPQVPYVVAFQVTPHERGPSWPVKAFEVQRRRLHESYTQWFQDCTKFETGTYTFDRLINRSVQDLRLLMATFGQETVVTAGVPWYAVPFGRDSLITALQSLSLNPSMAVGTLRFLARYQGTERNDWRDEEPGKILHELRQGEMVNLGEIPHTPYYGTVDATPLFLMLFAATMDWLDDDALYRELLPAAKKAIAWMDRDGDLDGDGYLEYQSRSSRGLRNQGWKDSHDSVFYPDGRLVDPPIALVEVQAYAYAARKGMADLLRRKGEVELANQLDRQASNLKERFNRDFWLPDQGYLAIALDPNKQPVDLLASNMGHALYCGILEEEKAQQVVEHLTSGDMACGWGIRTVSSRVRQFNPMSYHNGSIWPHDNSLIVAGMRRYGFDEQASYVMRQIYEAALHFRYYRLPELFCGFARDEAHYSTPAEYPVRCSPQAWASGATILMVQSMLGLEADAARGHLYVSPHLPAWLERMVVRDLRVGEATLDFVVARAGEETHVEVLHASRGIALEARPGIRLSTPIDA